MHGVNSKKMLPIVAAFMLSASASHMSIPMNAAYSAENEMSITADSIIPDGLYSIKNVNSGKYLSQRYENVLQLSSPKVWRIKNQPDGSCFITYSDDYALTVECGTGADGNNISLQRADGSFYGDYYLIYAYRWREQMVYSTCTDLLKGDWKFDELSKKRRDELMSTAELLDEVLLEPYILDANLRLLVRKINVYENEDGSLDVTLEFNGDFKDTSTECFEIND